MTNKAPSIETLKKYARLKAREVNQPALVEDLMKESDRAAVIIAATMIEDALEAALTDAMVEKTTYDWSSLFRADQMLGAFSSKIKLCAALGIISPEVTGLIDDIREMRNACAHSRQPISFETPELLGVAKRIFYPAGPLQVISGKRDNIRKSFILTCIFIVGYIENDDASTDLMDLPADLVLMALDPEDQERALAMAAKTDSTIKSQESEA